MDERYRDQRAVYGAPPPPRERKFCLICDGEYHIHCSRCLVIGRGLTELGHAIARFVRRAEVAGLAELAKQATRHARPCVPGIDPDAEDCGCSVRQSRAAIDALARLAMAPSPREVSDV